MQLKAINRFKLEQFCLAWAALGVYLFLSAFFWASGPAPLRAVFYVFLLIPFLLVLPWRRWRIEEYGGYYTISALVFSAYCVCASLWGNASDFDFYLKQWFFLAFWLCGIAWLFYYRPVNLQRLYLFIIVIGVICSLVTVYFFYVYKNYSIAARLSGFGLAENSTIVAQIFGVASLLSYIKSLQAENWKLSPLFFIAAMICALVILMSQTRGAALALILVSFAALLLVRPKPLIWVPQVTLAVLGVIGLFMLTNMGDVLQDRGVSFSYRDAIWVELLDRARERPLFGLGLERDARIIIPDVDVFHHAHNSWIDILYYTGLMGLLLALWHWVLLARSFSRDQDSLPLYLWLAYGSLCLFTNGSSLLTRPDAQWLMYWVPAGLLAALVMSRRQCPAR
jgi:O-antigen ligase